MEGYNLEVKRDQSYEAYPATAYHLIHPYIIITWSDKAFKDTAINRALTTLYGGSLEITRPVPLRPKNIEDDNFVKIMKIEEAHLIILSSIFLAERRPITFRFSWGSVSLTKVKFFPRTTNNNNNNNCCQLWLLIRLELPSSVNPEVGDKTAKVCQENFKKLAYVRF